ncbi:MAG: hypothetical protein WD271_10345 [Acidimicrobiia bacterium]
MTREARRRQIAALVVPRLDTGEELLGMSVTWAARVGRTALPFTGLLFTGRHLHLLALTDRRLFVFERRSRGNGEAEPVLAELIEHLALERARSLLTMYQVLVVASDGRRLVFEFRFRDRATGRALARMLRATRQL